MNSTVPDFLESFENLTSHFDEHFGELGSNGRGDTFLNLAEKLVPLSDEFSRFPAPVPNTKKSHDKGVDLLTSEAVDGQILCVQSKYKIKDKPAFDSIISKFKDFEASQQKSKPAPDLFPDPKEAEAAPPIPVFAVVTSSKLEGVIEKYRQSTLASKAYYELLCAERRLLILDGPRILIILQHLYRKAHLTPVDVVVKSVNKWFHTEDVYIGGIRGRDLTDLYEKHGDALFFENIRDFLGLSSGRINTSRETVNQEIIHTIREEPGRMLTRNNGITFRATSATENPDGSLRLTLAAIVNGCQTTMCLVGCRPVSEECLVPIKVVVAEDAWDIAKATNYQNQVARVDLDLARFLRPQLARRAAARLGYAVGPDSESTASAVLDTIYQSKIDYDELRLLYLGLFSRKPNNIFEGNYTELRSDVLAQLYGKDENEEQIFFVLLLMLKHSKDALADCQQLFSHEEYTHLFKRFFLDDKPKYRSFLSVAAAAACVRSDLSVRAPDADSETLRMRSFLGKCRDILENHPGQYTAAYVNAFAVIADSLLDVVSGKDDSDIQQAMYKKVSGMAFDSIYKRILLKFDLESRRK